MNNSEHNGNGSDDGALLKALEAVKDMEPDEIVSLSIETYNLVLLQLEGLKETIQYAHENLNHRIDVMAGALLEYED